MGIKRPVEDEFPEPSFSLPKQIDYRKRLNLNIEEPYIGGPKSYFCKLQYNEPLEDGDTDSAYVPDKQLEAIGPLSLVTSTSSEEDSGDGPSSFWPYFPENDFTIPPRRPPEQFQSPYISLLNGPPRKDIPVGPDYQAEILMWDPNAFRKHFSHSHYFSDNKCGKELTGTCIIPMPDFNDLTIDILKAGRGRTDCNCMDVGSVRCVQQHVNEARDKLRESIGDENFGKLGFNEMGEEVACKWARREEQVFHKIVVSNCAVFWEHLRAEFPTRKMKELVSYYFNVFMLRRRAAQNRSFVLEIDSDDDEQNDPHEGFYSRGFYSLDRDIGNGDDAQGHNGECYFVGGEEDVDDDDDDLTVESFGDDASWVDEFWAEPEKVDRENKAQKQNDGIIGESNVDKRDGFEKVNSDPVLNLE